MPPSIYTPVNIYRWNPFLDEVEKQPVGTLLVLSTGGVFERRAGDWLKICLGGARESWHDKTLSGLLERAMERDSGFRWSMV